jgi:hypothetical protein
VAVVGGALLTTPQTTPLGAIATLVRCPIACRTAQAATAIIIGNATTVSSLVVWATRAQAPSHGLLATKNL